MPGGGGGKFRVSGSTGSVRLRSFPRAPKKSRGQEELEFESLELARGALRPGRPGDPGNPPTGLRAASRCAPRRICTHTARPYARCARASRAARGVLAGYTDPAALGAPPACRPAAPTPMASSAASEAPACRARLPPELHRPSRGHGICWSHLGLLAPPASQRGPGAKACC